METPHFSNYKQNELVDFLNRMQERINGEWIDTLALRAAFDHLSLLANKVINASLPSNEVIETAMLTEADTSRDSIVVSVRMVTNAYRNYYEASKRHAAENVYSCIAKYGTQMERLNYVSETSATSKFCNEVITDTSLAADIELLGLTTAINDLQTANDAFNQLYNDRLDQKEKHNEVQFAADLKVATAACRNFYQLVESMASFSADPESFQLIISKMELLATEYNTIVDQRIGMAQAQNKAEIASDE